MKKDVALSLTNGWKWTTIGTLSAFEAHNPGHIIGCQVVLTVDHTGTNDGSTYRGELTAMGRSEFSAVYYHIEITGGTERVTHKLDLPLSHEIYYLPKVIQTDADTPRDATPVEQELGIPIRLGDESITFYRPATDAERAAKYASLDRITSEREFCSRGTCRNEIHMQIFKGTGFCSTNCYKIAHGQSIAQEDNHPKGSA